MNINRTKCDQCGKEHDPENVMHIVEGTARLVSLRVSGIHYDLCDMSCLTNFVSNLNADIQNNELAKTGE